MVKLIIGKNIAKKLTLRTENGQFFTTFSQVVLQDIKKPFEKAYLDSKI